MFANIEGTKHRQNRKYSNELVRPEVIERSPTNIKLFIKPKTFICNGNNNWVITLLITEQLTFESAISVEKKNVGLS